MPPRLFSVNFRLRSATHDFFVDVRLRSFGERWLAVADISGDREVGLGADARQALSATLESLGPQAAAAFLADPQLIAVTSDVRKA